MRKETTGRNKKIEKEKGKLIQGLIALEQKIIIMNENENGVVSGTMLV